LFLNLFGSGLSGLGLFSDERANDVIRKVVKDQVAEMREAEKALRSIERAGGKMTLSDELFDKFIKLIYMKTGMFYDCNKKYYVQKRVEKRAEALEIESLEEYYYMLKFNNDLSEFEKLINELTVNETYFFRDFPQLRNFAEDVLPVVVREKRNDKTIKVWSAACSTGEEPYTLSIILQEMLDNPEEWDLQIIASDINTEVLKCAKIGLYESRAVKDVPHEYLEKYFTKRDDKYFVNWNVRRLVEFKRINLACENEISTVQGCDFIFCRNCLIYFDDESRKNVVDSLYEALNPGGFIFLGHSESVGRISSAFKVQRIGDAIVYSKPK
jgi:chemotaxis protein methyltransferase CheR